MHGDFYDEEYYERGVESGKSLYERYRWLENLTVPMCKAIAEHCEFSTEDRILDFGCAKGFVVKALRILGYNRSFGCDISTYALQNADPDVAFLLGPPEELLAPTMQYEWIIAKDVLEHVDNLRGTVASLMQFAKIGMFVVVPLAYGKTYAVPEYEKDVTHLHRLHLPEWAEMFMHPGWSVEARYRLPGVKDNYAAWERGNGFLTCRRLENT